MVFPPENWPTDFHPLPSVDPVIGNLAWVNEYKPLLGVVRKHIGHGWRVWEGPGQFVIELQIAGIRRGNSKTLSLGTWTWRGL